MKMVIENIVLVCISLVLTALVSNFNESLFDVKRFIVDPYWPIFIVLEAHFLFMLVSLRDLYRHEKSEIRIILFIASVNSFLGFESFMLAVFTTLDVNIKFIIALFFIAVFIFMLFLQYWEQQILKDNNE